jgi:hypothetical protein
MGQRADQHIVSFRDGAPNGVFEHLSDVKFLEIEPGHAASCSQAASE